MNQNAWGYQSSFAGSPIAAVVAAKVLEIVQRQETLTNIARIEGALRAEFSRLCDSYPEIFLRTWVQGCIAAIALSDRRDAQIIKGDLFKRGVMCHSTSSIDPQCVKFFPCLTSTPDVVGEIAEALGEFAADRRREKS